MDFESFEVLKFNDPLCEGRLLYRKSSGSSRIVANLKQARSHLKSIFDEAIEQDFLVKDPTRKLKIPRNLRPKDRQILT